MKLNYEEFVAHMREIISEKLGDGYEVNTERVLKNNSCEYFGVVIQKKSDDDNKVAPAIYMYSWYEKYLSGKGDEDIVNEILDVYYECEQAGKKIDIDNISKDFINERLFFRLVNKERNKELLENTPHIDFLDLVITFHYQCMLDDSGVQSFRITDKIAKDWNLDTATMFKIAKENTKRMFPDVINNLDDVIMRLLGNYERINEDGIIHMYVLTNYIGINGAATILYTDKIAELAEEFGEDLYILPSSIHEIILVPNCEELEFGCLKRLVKEVNETQVLPEERLSDSVYMYLREENRIIMC